MLRGAQIDICGGDGMKYTKLKSINEYVSESINPMSTPTTVFEMYSVPIYETGRPEYLRGAEIASNKVVVQKDDVLLCKINPRINRVWVVADESEHLSIASSEWIVVRSSAYNPQFLAWYFRSPRFKQLMVSEVTGIGGSLTRAQPKAVAEYPVPVLNRTEQDQITAILNTTASIMENRKKQLSALDDLIKARFVEIFGDPETNPMCWPECSLSEMLNVLGGYAFKSDGFSEVNGIPVLRIGNINAGFFKPVNMVFWEEDVTLERYIMYPGDLVMSLTGTVGKDDYGNVCILGSDYDKYYLNQRNAKLELKKGLDKQYISQLLRFEKIKKRLTGISRGVRQANISNRDILNLVVPIPPIGLQRQFSEFVVQIDKSKSAIQKSLDETQLLFDSLMQKYFS